MTSPISGRVVSLGERGEGTGKTLVATIENDRVDRSTLIGLQTQATAFQNELRLKRAIVADYTDRVIAMERDLARQKVALLKKAQYDVSSAEANVRMTEATAANEIIDAKRKIILIGKGAAAGSKEEFLNQIALQEAKINVARAAAESVTGMMGDAQDSIYFGADRQSLDGLQRDIRTRRADLSQYALEAAALETKLASLQTLSDSEEKRVVNLTRAEVVLDPTQTLRKSVAQVGKQINIGDTITESINCNKAFVVAIFSERQAQSLAVGSSVAVGFADGQTLPGIVSQLLPRTTERVDRDYAVPFPPTERRELYAFITPDREKLESAQSADFCKVGSWVSVDAQRQWIEHGKSYANNVVAAVTGFGPFLAERTNSYARASAEAISAQAAFAWHHIDWSLSQLGNLISPPATAYQEPKPGYRLNMPPVNKQGRLVGGLANTGAENGRLKKPTSEMASLASPL